MSLRDKVVGILADAMKQAAADDAEEEPQIVDECPAGGEHDEQEIRPATAGGAVVFRYCKRCRADLTGK
jgi:hypothetical protein